MYASVARASARMPIDAGTTFPISERIDVDVDDLRARREGRRFPGDAIVEAAADVEEHIALLDRAIHVHPAVHSGHAEAQLVRFGEGALAVQRRDHGNARALGERAQLRGRTRLDYAVSRHDEWPLRPGEERGRALDRSAIEDAGTLVAWQTQGLVPSRDGPRLLRILGDVDEDGAGAPTAREVECFLDDIRNILDVLNEIIVFRDRDGDAGDVGFLERVGSERGTRDLSGDRDQRRASPSTRRRSA